MSEPRDVDRVTVRADGAPPVTTTESTTTTSEPEDAGPVTTTDSKKSGEGLLSPGRLLILLGTVLAGISYFFEWWELKLVAPQYPGGLFITVSPRGIADSPKTPSMRDVNEVNSLNHYIGMMSLDDAAKFELMIAPFAITAMVILALVAVFVRKRWSPWLALPVVLFPFLFMADMFYWLRRAGQNLDPMAAITIEPFTPTIVGTGYIGQFSTVAVLQTGFWIAVAGAVLTLIGIILSMMRSRAIA